MSEIQALARGLHVLDLLMAADEGLSVSEIARQLGVNKSTASRIAQTLAKYDWAESHPTKRLYRIGAKFSLINTTHAKYDRLQQIAHPFLHYLMQNTGECAHIAVNLNDTVYVLDDVESNSMLRVSAGVGRTTHLHCTAIGKVLLAFANTPVPQDLEIFTDNTITDKLQLQEHLKQIRNNGFAIDDEEFEPGVRCIAAPVFGYANHCIGSIGVSGPSIRIHAATLQTIIHEVQSTARQLSSVLGSNKNDEDM